MFWERKMKKDKKKKGGKREKNSKKEGRKGKGKKKWKMKNEEGKACGYQQIRGGIHRCSRIGYAAPSSVMFSVCFCHPNILTQQILLCLCQSSLSNSNSPTVKYLNRALDLPQKPFSPYILASLWLMRAIKARQNIAEISTLVLPYLSTAYEVISIKIVARSSLCLMTISFLVIFLPSETWSLPPCLSTDWSPCIFYLILKYISISNTNITLTSVCILFFNLPHFCFLYGFFFFFPPDACL